MSVVVVAGALANKPLNGGEAWVRLGWVRGLRRLGFDVHLVEQLEAAACHDGDGAPCPPESSVQVAFFRQATELAGLQGRALLLVDGVPLNGEAGAAPSLAADAAALINISGHLRGPLLRRFRRRIYVDLDPGYTQFWDRQGLDPGLGEHDLHYTVADNIGRSDCGLPDCGLGWRTVRPPVVLEDWPAAPPADHRFTTVASWRGAYGPVEHQGRRYGVKAHEFRKFMRLPRRVPARFEVALAIHPADDADLTALRRHGWAVVDPRRTVPDPAAFREYIRASGAEFSVAQGIYVETRSGWFSDRSALYLASGRPVVVQDTGFGRTLPVGDGLLAFRTLEEAATCAERVLRDPAAHGAAARALAESFFDSDLVLGRFADEIGLAA